MNCPIILSDEVTVTSNQNKPMPEASFKNPHLTAMEVDEIRFLVDAAESPDVVDSFRGYGGVIQCGLSLGRLPITGGTGVPIWLFGGALATNETFGTDTSERYTMRLKHPLYVPYGATLRPRILHGAVNGNTVSTDVRVTLVGRSLPRDHPVPETIQVPWVSGFMGANNAGGAAYTDETTEADLCNPFNVPLRVDYMVGRILRTSGASDAVEPIGSVDALASTNTFARMSDHAGGPVVRDETPFSHLFQRWEHVFRCRGAVMPPHSFFKLWLREAWSTFGAGSSYQPQVSLVGYREVEMRAARMAA